MAESFITIEIDDEGNYKVFVKGKELTKNNQIPPEKAVEEINERKVRRTFSNPFVTYLELNSAIIWMHGKPHYVP